MSHRIAVPLLASLFVCTLSSTRGDAVYFDLTTGALEQDWSVPGLILSHDNWSGVPSVVGYRGDGLADTGTSPAVVLAEGGATPIDVLANQSNTNSGTGGVAEFQSLANPTIALQGSGTASAPFLLFHLDASGVDEVRVAYRLRDLDGSGDNAQQSVALQYRLGLTGDFFNVAGAWVSDATAGPSLAGLETPVDVLLPSLVAGVAQLQLRILTVDAVGSDEWVGVDDIVISGRAPSATVPDALPAGWLAGAWVGVLAAARRRAALNRPDRRAGRAARAPALRATARPRA